MHSLKTLSATSAVAFAALGVVQLTSTASAQTVSVTVENLQPAGGVSLTPFWLGLHDGTFDSYDGGSLLNPEFAFLESLAELGLTDDISAAFAASNPEGVDTTLASGNAVPVFSPGDSATFDFVVDDPTQQRFFSYASMVVPSNDLFVANGNPLANEVFDAAGNFTGPFTIELFGSSINDAGTELNDVFDGPAFVINQPGPGGTPQNQVVTNYFDLEPEGDYLQTLVGIVTPVGTVTSVPGEFDLIGRITVVPEPGTAGALAAAAGLTLLRRRRGA
ncbi:MAG: spondin domain-containing protein [Planctomycetota bacterium]